MYTAPSDESLATRATDALLLAAWIHGAQSMRIDPASAIAYRVTLSDHGRVVASASLPVALALAVIERLSELANLERVASLVQVGRLRVSFGEQVLAVWVTVDVVAGDAVAELWISHSGDNHGRGLANDGEDEDDDDVVGEGSRVGPYVLVEVLGEGGMGVVYRAHHRLLDKWFAIKVLRHDALDADPHAVGRLYAEARVAARLRSPHIVGLSDIGILGDGRPYLVMEYADGNTLEDVVEHVGALEPAAAVSVALGIARALVDMHAQNVIHCDLKPANVIVRREDDAFEIKVLDFGIARLGGLRESSDKDSGLVGCSALYASPEQARGHECSARSDLYSLGIVLFQLLQGSVPFDGDDGYGILIRHVRETAPEVTSPHRRLPARLVRLVRAMLSKQPEQRPATAGEVVDILNECARELSPGRWSNLWRA